MRTIIQNKLHNLPRKQTRKVAQAKYNQTNAIYIINKTKPS